MSGLWEYFLGSRKAPGQQPGTELKLAADLGDVFIVYAHQSAPGGAFKET